jgi:hypothetical protein
VLFLNWFSPQVDCRQSEEQHLTAIELTSLSGVLWQGTVSMGDVGQPSHDLWRVAGRCLGAFPSNIKLYTGTIRLSRTELQSVTQGNTKLSITAVVCREQERLQLLSIAFSSWRSEIEPPPLIGDSSESEFGQHEVPLFDSDSDSDADINVETARAVELHEQKAEDNGGKQSSFSVSIVTFSSDHGISSYLY